MASYLPERVIIPEAEGFTRSWLVNSGEGGFLVGKNPTLAATNIRAGVFLKIFPFIKKVSLNRSLIIPEDTHI